MYEDTPLCMPEYVRRWASEHWPAKDQSHTLGATPAAAPALEDGTDIGRDDAMCFFCLQRLGHINVAAATMVLVQPGAGSHPLVLAFHKTHGVLEPAMKHFVGANAWACAVYL
jgi:hypothetical protein